MNTVETKLNILIDGLKAKEQSLLEIVSITENQTTVLESELETEHAQAFIFQMNQEKQVHIQQVITCDNLFESILKEIGPELDADQSAYMAQVKVLQEYIKSVMDLDVKIRILEEKNNQLMDKRKTGIPAPPVKKKPSIPKDANRVIDAYKNNARN
jgi:hypothetical protein